MQASSTASFKSPNPTPQEWAKTLRVCTGEFVAAAEGAWAGGATEIWIHAAHDVDVELLPPGVQVIRGVRLWDEVIYQEGDFDALVVVGQHGGAHLVDCALAHTCLPFWQIEASTGFQQGWIGQIAPQIGQLRVGEFSTVREDAHTISASAPSGREIAALRFLFARPADALDGLTELEDYGPPEWLKQGAGK